MTTYKYRFSYYPESSDTDGFVGWTEALQVNEKAQVGVSVYSWSAVVITTEPELPLGIKEEVEMQVAKLQQEEAWSATCKALEDGALKADFYEVKA